MERAAAARIAEEHVGKLQSQKWHRASEWRVGFSRALSVGYMPKGAQRRLKTLKTALLRAV